MGSRAEDGEWSCVGDGQCTGGVKGADAAVGALVWVTRSDGCWWPGQILGGDELPENCAIPPLSADKPVKLLGRPDGSIDWYNLEKSNHVKPFRCGEFDECIENAKFLRRPKNIPYNKGKCALRNDAIMHALEIEMSRCPNEEPTNQTTDCSKEDIPLIQDRRKTKVKIISFVTPISKENHKRDNSSLRQLDEGAMKCQALESDAVELDARVEGAVFKPGKLENNIKVYDVEMASYGNYKGHGLPLAFLMSKSTGKPIKGYPVTVEVLEDGFPAPSTKVHTPAISCFDCLMESRISVPRQSRYLRKPSGCRKISEHDLDKSWGPSTQNFSSYCNSPRKSPRKRSNREPVVSEDFLPPIRSPSKPASPPRQMHSFSDSRRENANREPCVVKGSPRPGHSPPVDAMDNSESKADDEFHSDCCADEYQSDRSTDEYHSGSSADEDYVKPTTLCSGSRPPLAMYLSLRS